MKIWKVIICILILISVSLIWYSNTYVVGSIPAKEFGQKAVKKGDVTLCGKLKRSIFDATNSEEGLKLNCAKEAAIGLKDPSACEFVPGEWKYFCYVDVAIALDDQNICSRIDKNSPSQGKCYIYFARKLSDVAICDLIGPTLYQGECYGEFPSAIQDVSKCEQLTDLGSRSMCIIGYVENVEPDLSLCDQLTNNVPKYKDMCKKVIAQQTLDIDLCNTLTVKSDRNNCIRNVERQQVVNTFR